METLIELYIFFFHSIRFDISQYYLSPSNINFMSPSQTKLNKFLCIQIKENLNMHFDVNRVS